MFGCGRSLLLLEVSFPVEVGEEYAERYGLEHGVVDEHLRLHAVTDDEEESIHAYDTELEL